MKKILKATVLLAVVAAMAFGFAACGEKTGDKDDLNFDVVYAMAADLGFCGDLEDLIEAFKGDSAYEVAVSMGYGGTESEWLATLVGAKGSDGLTPHIGDNGNWWIGDKDTTVKARGERGDNGKSAYELAVENGYKGTEQQWLESLSGANGKNAYELAVENGYNGTLDQWLASLSGANGAAGKSAYEIWLENGGCGEANCDCTEADFKEWLNGPQGEPGLSAYDIFKKHYPEYTGSEKQWITDLAADRLIRTVTFKADGMPDIEISLLFGTSLAEIPAVPVKPGNDGAWNIADFENITENLTVNAVYSTQGLQYELDGSGTAFVVGGKDIGGDTEQVFIPESYDGLPVTEIKKNAFQGKTALRSISIPSSITVVGENAFENTGIMNNSPVNEAVYAGNWAVGFKEEQPVAAFARSRAARTTGGNVTLAEGTVGVADKAFFGKTALTGITMPDSVRHIGIRSFEGCASLGYAVLSKNLARTADYAFMGCGSLASIEIPASVEFIGNNSFRNCKSLGAVTFAADGKLRNIGWNAFDGCVALTKVAVPSSVMIMGDGAFANCTALADIEIASDNIQIFCANVFKGSAWLDAQPDGPLYIGGILYAYKGDMPANAELVIADGTRAVAGNALKGQANLNKITIPASVVSIWTGAFDGCSSLDEIALDGSNKLQNVARSVFNNTAWLDAQPDGPVYIGNVLYTYKGLMPENTELTVAAGTYGIAGGAFQGQSNLISIDLPSSVAYIGDHAFDGCIALTNISIPHKVWSMGDRSFMNCSSLTSIVIPESVLDIGTQAFIGCNDLTVYAQNASLTNGWDSYWNFAKCPVVWNCELSTDGRVVSVVKTANSIANPNAANGISAPLCDGYVFEGWAISAEQALNKISSYSAADIHKAHDGTTLWAIWTAV